MIIVHFLGLITLSVPSANLEYHLIMLIGYEPADLTVHPPQKNDRGWVYFFRIGVLCHQKFFHKEKVEFVGDIHIRTHKNVVLRHNHSNPISTRLTSFDNIE